ncbi:hypothetical protein GOP47_0000615 [Adiantum capillus-veneris]|uniref:Bystin n=1 Tax=Adiantum capillus-veneris TaxID=13818 RepID=A0A9D4ZSG8_ADICA|nr:hypothetical protein GOP47_0000615 [Adiantum capillus-veneris]
MATSVKPLSQHRYHPEKKKKKHSQDEPPSKHGLSLPQTLLDEDADNQSTQSRSSKQRKLQERDEFVSTSLSKKILQEAQRQQKEIQRERDEETGVAAVRAAFSSIDNDLSSEDEDEDGGFLDSQSYAGEFEEIPEEEEKILAMFMADKVGPQKTLADLIMQKIQLHDSSVKETEERPVPAVDAKVIEVYRGVGKLLSRFTSGKVPKAFKIIPSLSNWEEVLYLTEPENWSACAMYQATRIFASNLNAKMAQRFYNLVLLPRVREDINSNKRLHFALYQALKKSVYKPSAFYKGILLPLCQSRTCNLREAVIIGSVIQKVSIPSLHSSVALLKIAEMEYCGTNSYFMKLLLDKKYALPYRVLDGVIAHFMRFLEDERTMPVIWHQCLLSFVQRYKNELKHEDKDNLEKLMRQHKHYLMTPEIKRELHHSLNRGQNGADVSMDDAIQFTGIKTPHIEEDIWNLPEVPLDMEE